MAVAWVGVGLGGYQPGMLGRVLSMKGACSLLRGIVPFWPALSHAYQHFEVMKLVCGEQHPPHTHTCEVIG